MLFHQLLINKIIYVCTKSTYLCINNSTTEIPELYCSIIVCLNQGITANKSDSNESQSFFLPDLRHCLFVLVKFSRLNCK